MKKLCVLLLALTLSGCSLLDVLSEPAVDLNGGGETATFSPSNETMNYHYHQLSEEEQRLYGLLLPALEEMAEAIELGQTDGQALQNAFVAVMQDNPALFHVENDYTYEEYSDGTITMKPQYYFDAQRKADIQKQVDAQTETILHNLPADTQEAAWYLYEYVAEHAEYASGPQDQSMVSFFLDGQTVCAGYAKTYQYLMEKAGIPTTYISGELNSDEAQALYGTSAHAWNMVNIGGDYYYMDVTSGDVTQYGPHVCHQYFMMSSQEMDEMYTADGAVEETADPQGSYMQNHGLYLETYDETVLQNAIDEMRARGDQVLELRTAPRQGEQLREELLQGNRIFDLLQRNGYTVSELGCAQQPDLGSIEFYFE